MELYIVKGNLLLGKYTEYVEIIEGLEEKLKSYVRKGTRIKKSSIGKIEQGLFIDSYQIALTNKDEIQEARQRIKDHITNKFIKKKNDILRDLNAIENYSLNTDVKFKRNVSE